MDIIIAGNTSLALYCLEKLCRKGFPVTRVVIPEKSLNVSTDSVDFSGLAGEFDLKIMKISASSRDDRVIETDVLINLEWPNTLKLPVKSRIARVGSNLAGQFDGEFLVDVAAELYNGCATAEIQLILEQDIADYEGVQKIAFEPPFFTVLGNTDIELNPLDDLRSVKTKAACGYYRLLEDFLNKLGKTGKIPRRIDKELIFKKVKADRIIDWGRGSLFLHNMIQAYTHPGPGAYTWLDDKKMIIWRGHYFDLSENVYRETEPGTIVDIIEELGIVVKTGHGLFLITRIQSLGSPELPAWVWASERHVNPSEKFEIYLNNKQKISAR